MGLTFPGSCLGNSSVVPAVTASVGPHHGGGGQGHQVARLLVATFWAAFKNVLPLAAGLHWSYLAVDPEPGQEHADYQAWTGGSGGSNSTQCLPAIYSADPPAPHQPSACSGLGA